MRTRWIMVLVLAPMLAACSHGEVDRAIPPDRPPPPSTPTAEATRSVPSSTPRDDPAPPAVVSGRTERPSRQPAVDADPPAQTAVRLHFVRGEQVEPVTRHVPSTPRIGGAALHALLAGPTPHEAAQEFASLIPRGTQVRSLSIEDGTASLDLTRHFMREDEGYFMALRFAQVTCTLTQFPTVDGVRFAIDGTYHHAPTVGKTVVRRPVECLDYAGMVPVSALGLRAGIWPFTDQAALDAYARGSDDTYRDPGETARLFATRYVAMRDVIVSSTDIEPGRAVIGIARTTGEGDRPLDEPHTSMWVVLRQLGSHHDGPWTVVHATAANIEVHSLEAGQAIASPVRLEGMASAYEGTVQVEVRQDGMQAGDALGRGFVTGSGGAELGPFPGSIGFARPTEHAGAIVLFEASAADGGSPVLFATVTRVTFAH